MCVCVCVPVQSLSHVRLFVTPWTVAHQAPLSMGFPRQEYSGGWPFPSAGDLLAPGTDDSPMAQWVRNLPAVQQTQETWV